MRTTEAARYARWSVTVAAMLAIMVICAYVWRGWEARQAQGVAPPPVPAAVQQQSQEFSFSKVDGNNTRFIVRASRATEFKEGGRTLLEDVWITTFGGDGHRSDQLHTRTCEYLAPTGTVTCPEEVLIDLQGHPPEAAVSGDAAAVAPAAGDVRIVTSHLTFQRETGIATSDDPVQFRFPQGEGRAVGLTYDSQRGELHLLREVELVLRTASEGAAGAPAPPPGDPMTISSDALMYRRDDRMIQLTGATTMRRGRQELQCGAMTIELDQNFAAQRLIAREKPVLHNPLGDADVSVSADELSAPLEGSGQLHGVVATGNVVLNALRPDGRHELTGASAVLDMVPESQQPRHFSAAGNVVVVSRLQDGSTRRLATPQLEVEFDPGETQSHVQRATAQSATMDWRISGEGAARPAAEAMRLKGQVLDGMFDASGELRELRGTGGVEVQKSAPGETPMTSTSSELLARIAEGGDWSTVDQTGGVRMKNASGDAQADRAHFDRAADTTTLTGSVLLNDASSQTRAQTATFRQNANELRAEGNVSTTELAKPGTAAVNGQADPAHISSNRMTADTATGRAVYTGRARLWQGESVIQADSIDLDRNKHVLVATGSVNAVFPEARGQGVVVGTGRGKASNVPSPHQFWRAEAARMTYEENEHRARLEQGAHAHSEEGSIRADRIDLFFAPDARTESPGGGSLLGENLTGQQVQRAQGFGNVRVESAGRTGTGERADYGAAESKFILSGGHPKLIDEFGNSTAGRQLTFFFTDDRILVDSEEGSRTLTLHRVEK